MSQKDLESDVLDVINTRIQPYIVHTVIMSPIKRNYSLSLGFQ